MRESLEVIKTYNTGNGEVSHQMKEGRQGEGEGEGEGSTAH